MSQTPKTILYNHFHRENHRFGVGYITCTLAFKEDIYTLHIKVYISDYKYMQSLISSAAKKSLAQISGWTAVLTREVSPQRALGASGGRNLHHFVLEKISKAA